MKTSRSHSAAPHADRAAKEEHTKRRASARYTHVDSEHLRTVVGNIRLHW
ncbi:MAG: hypothetical protein WCC08_22090 [Terrimicrobiaceae bacterium]